MTRNTWHEKFVAAYGREPTKQEWQTALENGDVENNPFVDGEVGVHIHLTDTFSEVFRKHSRQEADRIFISGTSLTTPRQEDIAATRLKPNSPHTTSGADSAELGLIQGTKRG